MYIQDLIQQKLLEQGINKHQLHKATDIPYSSVRDFLYPNNKVDLVKMRLICGVIGVDMWALFREYDHIKAAEGK